MIGNAIYRSVYGWFSSLKQYTGHTRNDVLLTPGKSSKLYSLQQNNVITTVMIVILLLLY
jgi:hypothetical protein